MAPRSMEEDMLHVIAHFHPVDFATLKRVLAEWRGGHIDYETYRDARSNLAELDLIKDPMMDEHIYLTAEGWQRLGGETPFESE
ncbi:hypothetical protein C439_10515 [Haloferax mediterranei ATCC 33500]|nr:hypothetical protein C439_10515 [Haloferax mediterranei ATCC 33500]